jgi:hypothetical protein
MKVLEASQIFDYYSLTVCDDLVAAFQGEDDCWSLRLHWRCSHCSLY